MDDLVVSDPNLGMNSDDNVAGPSAGPENQVHPESIFQNLRQHLISENPDLATLSVAGSGSETGGFSIEMTGEPGISFEPHSLLRHWIRKMTKSSLPRRL